MTEALPVEFMLAGGLRGLLFLFAVGLCLGCAAAIPRRKGPAILGLFGALLLLVTTRRGFLFGTMTAWFQLGAMDDQVLFVRPPAFSHGLADGAFGLLALSVLAAAASWAVPKRET